MANEVVVPDDMLSLPMQGLANLVADSTQFRSLVGAADQAAALKEIHFPYAEDHDDDDDGELDAGRPRAIINPGPGFKMTNKGAQSWNAIGNLYLCFEIVPDTVLHPKRDDQLLAFTNIIGRIMFEMMLNSARNLLGGGGTHLNMYEFDLVDGPGECVIEDESELFYAIIWLISWVN